MVWANLVLSLLLVQTPETTATVLIFGDVPTALTLTANELAKLPRTILITASANQSANQPIKYEGVSIRELLTRAGVPAGEELRGPELAKIVIVTGADGYRVSFALAELHRAFTDRVAILADRRDGKPLPQAGLPFQLILAEEKRPARWVRQVVSIEVRTPEVSR
jgi:DMSO/TMAO reductase YedYZ molybdopterin-dependent catalytic subunit